MVLLKKYAYPFCILLFISISLISKAQLVNSSTIVLDRNWNLQPYGEWKNDSTLVKPGVYSLKNKIVCNVPNTVLAALVESGKYKDIYFSDNLSKVPTQWFEDHWRYTKTFDVSKDLLKLYGKLCLDGINYYADVYLNGKKIASADTLKGAFRKFEIKVTGKLLEKNNILDIRVYPPKPGDFTIGFVDWTPNPPDKNMGLFRGVSIKFNGPVSITNPFVKTTINKENLSQAQLAVQCNVVNHSSQDITAIISAKIENIELTKSVELKPFENKLIEWAPKDNPQLNLKNARLWWPINMGNPDLYNLDLSVNVNNKKSDVASTSFGIREVTDYISDGYRKYKINGRDIQIHGGGWTDDLLLRESEENIKAQVAYTKQMNLNCIRLEGFWGATDKLYELCDKNGILLMVGWSCQWEWENYLGKKTDEHGGIQTAEDMDLVTQSLNDHVLWLRNHPSVFVWVLGSDMLPRPELEKRYLNDLSLYDPTRPALMACALKTSNISGTTGVKMRGPYDYVAPNYWYLDTEKGGAYGFNTETGPGPQIPVLESLKKMFPKEKMWPVNELWNYHSGRNEFNTISRYEEALNKRYGTPGSIEDFVRKAQLMNYEAVRPMFEAFRVNKKNAGGVVQWMLNASWPKLYWQLYDYYLAPTSAYFGTKSALAPLNIIYNYGDKNIYVSNIYYSKQTGLEAEVRLLDINSKEVFSKKESFFVEQFSSKKIIDLPLLDTIASPVYFLDLKILSGNKEVAKNFYWISSKEDVNDFINAKWHYTPLSVFADYTALEKMPKANVVFNHKVSLQSSKTIIDIDLKNTSNKIAFFIELKVKSKQTNEMILPAYWSDNYISILPLQSKKVVVEIDNKDLKGATPVIEMKGYNTP